MLNGRWRVFRPLVAGGVKARETRDKRVAQRVARKIRTTDILEIARAGGAGR